MDTFASKPYSPKLDEANPPELAMPKADKRKKHEPAFKAKVALAALRNDRSLTELSAQFNVHPSQISEWKRQLTNRAALVFYKQNLRMPAG